MTAIPLAPDMANLVDSAILSRMSARAFTSQPISRETIEHLLEVASRAPSGTNTQPWKVYVLEGASRESLGSEGLLGP
jgi:nitroreductase